MANRHEKEKAVNVQVLLRCRPFSDEELRSNAPQVVTCNEFQREVSVSQMIAGKSIDRIFTFDKVFGPSSQQRDLYDQAVVPIVNEVLEGFNCTIFAYGQTGTGKTYTMEGDCKRCKDGSHGELPLHAGVIPRAVKQIFDTLESQNAEYSVKVTFLELYNEEITDLLAPEEITKISGDDKQKKALLLMEDGKGGVLVRGLEEEIVTSAGEIFTLLERGSAKRRTAETLLNKQSSRSHSLFSITIHIKEATPEGEELIKCGKLNLVDLAGSENISRSGAREGRAREAGEINKSLLTLGRVITALVEHLGHIPYRDSKLTRLLRDSLGGRTKTCIIATVSPSVHCLDETLSTLDYAHRAKNIKNRPEVNQKMMKSTLIKDLYGEIERLKTELYAAREKVGVYVPKDRYYQEESERKAMTDQIEQMGMMLETNQKLIEELQGKYNAELQQSFDLRKKLLATEESLEHTSNLLVTTREDLRRAQYAIKEKDFIISEQKKAENALTHQAFVVRSDLEKAIQDNTSLFSKIAREQQLTNTNRTIVNNFQVDVANKINSLCRTVVSSMTQQMQQLQQVEELCKASLTYQEKSFLHLKEQVSVAQTQYFSRLESLQNSVHLHKACSIGSLEEISSATEGNCKTLENLLTIGEGTIDQILGDLQDKLSTHRCDIAEFSRGLRERFLKSLEHSKGMSNLVLGLLDNIGNETSELHNHASHSHDIWSTMFVDFQKAYEEQSRLENEKLLSEVSNLMSSRSLRLKELVDKGLVGFRDVALHDKEYMEASASSILTIKNEAKRKWEHIVLQAEIHSADGADFSSAKHCRLENILQQCVTVVDAGAKHYKEIDKSVKTLSRQHLTEVEALVKIAMETNDQHGLEIVSTCSREKEIVSINDQDVILQFEGILDQENKSRSQIMQALESHSRIIADLNENHAAHAKDIEQYTDNTFQQSYKDYEPSGNTPVRTEPEVPSKGTIETLRAMPVDALLEEFRENHPYISSKEPKPSLIPRSPLLPLN